MCQTPETCPQGHVSGVQDEGEGRGHAKHQYTPYKGVYWCSRWGEGEGTCQTPIHALHGCVLVFTMRGRGRGHVSGVWDKGEVSGTWRRRGRVFGGIGMDVRRLWKGTLGPAGVSRVGEGKGGTNSMSQHIQQLCCWVNVSRMKRRKKYSGHILYAHHISFFYSWPPHVVHRWRRHVCGWRWWQCMKKW